MDIDLPVPTLVRNHSSSAPPKLHLESCLHLRSSDDNSPPGCSNHKPSCRPAAGRLRTYSTGIAGQMSQYGKRGQRKMLGVDAMYLIHARIRSYSIIVARNLNRRQKDFQPRLPDMRHERVFLQNISYITSNTGPIPAFPPLYHKI